MEKQTLNDEQMIRDAIQAKRDARIKKEKQA